MCRCGTSGHGLAGIVVLCLWLDLMILEVFSNLSDSVIPYDLREVFLALNITLSIVSIYEGKEI